MASYAFFLDTKQRVCGSILACLSDGSPPEMPCLLSFDSLVLSKTQITQKVRDKAPVWQWPDFVQDKELENQAPRNNQATVLIFTGLLGLQVIYWGSPVLSRQVLITYHIQMLAYCPHCTEHPTNETN